MKKKEKPLAKNDFRPKIFQAKRTDWIGVAGMMLLGALIGFTISLFLPPKYEAVSKLTTNLEVVTTRMYGNHGGLPGRPGWHASVPPGCG